MPGLPGERTKSRQAWQQTADLFNELADKVKKHKMRVGYHNHTIEFKPLDGELPWDTFFGRTRREVVMQFDTGNAMEGGGDATVYLKKYPGRAATVHVKPFSKAKPNALMGEDELPWKEIFQPAIFYAEQGYPVPEIIHDYWRASAPNLAKDA